MNWVVGVVLVALGVTLVIAGAQGQANSLFAAVTGKQHTTSRGTGGVEGPWTPADVATAQTGAAGGTLPAPFANLDPNATGVA